MLSNMHTDLKQLILTSWKDRWSEKKWSIHIRKHLLQPSDVFHVADALVSQTFIGTSPNALLLNYVWHALNTGILTYGSVITAISKHEDLHKVESTKGIYSLLQQLIAILNTNPIIEDGMDLCCSLRMILQWLLRNVEQYLKGVRDVRADVAEELIKLDCLTLEQLTIKPRTSALLTIARFEESGVWSHIETDLAVIKNSSGQHSLHAEISEACHHVSQLSRISIKPNSVYTHMPTSAVYLHISGYIMLEVESMKCTDGAGAAQQLLLMSKIFGQTMAQLMFHTIRACLMGYLDAVNRHSGKEPHWCSLIFLRLPKIILHIKSLVVGSEFDSPSGSAAKKVAQFDASVFEALRKISSMDSLFDTLDQFGEDMNWVKIVTDHYASKQLISESAALQLQSIRNEQRGSMSHGIRLENPANPLTVVKAQTTVEQVLSALGTFDLTAEQDRLLTLFQSMCNCSSSFDTFVAAASATGQLPTFTSKLLLYNDSMKTSGGETVKAAQNRAILFDITFLMVCRIVKTFGKSSVFEGSPSQKKADTSFLHQWLDMWWLPHVKDVQSGKLETDLSRVDTLVHILQTSSEFRMSLTKWHDMCTNLPQAVMEFIRARQKGHITQSDLNRAIRLLRDHCPLSVCLVVIAAIARNARLVCGHSDYVHVLRTLATKSEPHSQLTLLYDQRYEFFLHAAEHLVSDLIPEFWRDSNSSDMSSVKMLQEAYNETRLAGWINHHRLKLLTTSYKNLGVVAFMKQILSLILQETRMNAVQNSVYVAFTCMKVDMESCMVYLLKHGLPRYFMSEEHALAPPMGLAIAQMTVAGLDLALGDAVLREKSLLSKHELSPFLHESNPDKGHDSTIKVRRMLSCSTEHDLAASTSMSGLSPDHPLLVVLGEFLQCLWTSWKEHRWGPVADYVVTFVKLALRSTPLLSQTVKQCIPAKVAHDLGLALVEESRELLFAASDLGNPELRRVVAQAVCHAKALT